MHWLEHTGTLKLDPNEPDLEDSTYLIPCFENLLPLVESVRRVGIINPTVVQRTPEGGLIPVLGRRRLLAARRAGVREVKTRVLPSEMPAPDGFQLAFWDNLGRASFDSAYSAYLVRRLLDLFPRDVVAGDFLPVLGISSAGHRLERFSAIGGLELPVLHALSSGKIHEKTAGVLAEMEPKDRLPLMELVDSLHLNANKAAEIVTSLHDLSILQGKAISELLRDRQCQSIVHDPESSVPEKASRFRELIRSWKFPELITREDEFNLWRRGLIDNDRIQVRPASAFESEECIIEIRARSRLETERIVSKIKKL